MKIQVNKNVEIKIITINFSCLVANLIFFFYLFLDLKSLRFFLQSKFHGLGNVNNLLLENCIDIYEKVRKTKNINSFSKNKKLFFSNNRYHGNTEITGKLP